MSPEAGPASAFNPRHLDYLRAAYEIDQRQEAHHKCSFNAGDWGEAGRLASEWCWMPYGRFLHLPGQPPTPLREACSDVDEGSGSSWSAVGRRGLLEVQERLVYLAGGAYRLPNVHLFPKGRGWDVRRHRLGHLADPDQSPRWPPGRGVRAPPGARAAGVQPGAYPDVCHIRITMAGRVYYLQRWQANVAAHPDVDAPNPFGLCSDRTG